jgi:hypothetical protein
MRFMVIVKAIEDPEAGVQVFEAEDFGAEFTPDPREREKRQRTAIAPKK